MQEVERREQEEAERKNKFTKEVEDEKLAIEEERKGLEHEKRQFEEILREFNEEKQKRKEEMRSKEEFDSGIVSRSDTLEVCICLNI